MDLQVYLEMAQFGLASWAAGPVTFGRSQMVMDDTQYDGATYYFEIHAINDDSSAVDVSLVDSSNNVKATVSVAAGTSTIERQARVSFTPVSGAEIYRVKIAATTNDNEVKVSCARIIVDQVSATKTCLQIPILSNNISIWQTDQIYSQNDTDGYTYASNPTSYANHLPTHTFYFQKDTSKFATIDSWRAEVVHCGTTGVNASRVQLWNVTDNALIDFQWGGSFDNMATSDTTPKLQYVDFADNTTNFDDLDYFEPRWKTSSALNQTRMFAFNLYVILTDLTKCEVLHRVQMQRVTTDGGDETYGLRRVLVEKSKFGTMPSVSFVASGHTEGTAEGTLRLRSHGENDSGVNGTNITSLDFDAGSSTRELLRQDGLSVTSDTRLITRTEWDSGGESDDFSVHAAFLVLTPGDRSGGGILTAPSFISRGMRF